MPKSDVKNILLYVTAGVGFILLIRKLVKMEFKSKYFNLNEFNSKDGAPMPENVKKNIQDLAKNLDVVREELNTPIRINSGYRSPAHNSAVGGVSNSYHTKGMAGDFVASGYTPAQVAQVLEDLIKRKKIKEGGIGIYSSWVHYDTRGTKARWNG
jgi:uncharacterized protein YcbK (DUF882 family)